MKEVEKEEVVDGVVVDDVLVINGEEGFDLVELVIRKWGSWVFVGVLLVKLMISCCGIEFLFW